MFDESIWRSISYIIISKNDAFANTGAFWTIHKICLKVKQKSKDKLIVIFIQTNINDIQRVMAIFWIDNKIIQKGYKKHICKIRRIFITIFVLRRRTTIKLKREWKTYVCKYSVRKWILSNVNKKHEIRIIWELLCGETN